MITPFYSPSDVKIGMVVVLNSGGPRMTIIEADGTATVMCVWFNRAGDLQSSIFLVSTLREPRDPPSGWQPSDQRDRHG